MCLTMCQLLANLRHQLSINKYLLTSPYVTIRMLRPMWHLSYARGGGTTCIYAIIIQLRTPFSQLSKRLKAQGCGRDKKLKGAERRENLYSFGFNNNNDFYYNQLNLRPVIAILKSVNSIFMCRQWRLAALSGACVLLWNREQPAQSTAIAQLSNQVCAYKNKIVFPSFWL